MFALSEAGNQIKRANHNPMLRRCAPCMGLTMLAPFGDLCCQPYSSKYFLPAIAVALVPMIIPPSVVFLYPLYVLPAAAYFVFIPKIFTASFQGKIWLRRQPIAEKV